MSVESRAHFNAMKLAFKNGGKNYWGQWLEPKEFVLDHFKTSMQAGLVERIDYLLLYHSDSIPDPILNESFVLAAGKTTALWRSIYHTGRVDNQSLRKGLIKAAVADHADLVATLAKDGKIANLAEFQSRMKILGKANILKALESL